MPLDGDGSEKLSVSPRPHYNHEAEAIMGVGYHVELAKDGSYGGLFVDRQRECKWRTGPAANLYKDGEIVKTTPSRDWSHEREQPVRADQVSAGAEQQASIQSPPTGDSTR